MTNFWKESSKKIKSLPPLDWKGSEWTDSCTGPSPYSEVETTSYSKRGKLACKIGEFNVEFRKWNGSYTLVVKDDLIEKYFNFKEAEDLYQTIKKNIADYKASEKKKKEDEHESKIKEREEELRKTFS